MTAAIGNTHWRDNLALLKTSISDDGLTWSGLWTRATATVTTSTPLMDVAQTWNDGAVTFTLLKANVTDTASAAASLLLDLQVGGASKFKVQKDGTITTAGNATIAGTLGVTGLSTFGSVVMGAFQASGGTFGDKVTIDVSTGGADALILSSTTFGNGIKVGGDTNLYRAAANSWATDDNFSVALGLVVGSPTGGNKGTGTINATAVYDDNVLLTDWVFDLHFDGKTAHPVPQGSRLYSFEETAASIREQRRLPWMPTRARFEEERSLGRMATRLWFGQEQQQIYLANHEERLQRLEAAA